MITKGIVEEVITPYKARVRLPILDGIKESRQGVATPDLGIATVCALPNSGNHISVGDIVFVGFEDMDLGKPIILGHLYKKTFDNTNIDIFLRQLSTVSTTKLSEHTSIGKISPNEIKTLRGSRFNIQNQIDALEERIEFLEKQLNITEKVYNITISINNVEYGSVNKTSFTAKHGELVTANGNELTIGDNTIIATPAVSSDYKYTFNEWQNVPSVITGDVNIVANFNREYIGTIY